MKKSVLLIAVLLPLITFQVLANELLVLSGDKSHSSKRWQEEVLSEYTNSEVGQTLSAEMVTVQGASLFSWFNDVIEGGRAGEFIRNYNFCYLGYRKQKEAW